MADQIVFSRGDAAYHTFSIPATSWSSGGTLFFAAKPVFDDDNTDVNAVIRTSWTDANLLADVIIGGITYKKYSCYFAPSATNSILSGGAPSADYLGEFQFVPLSGNVITAPAVGDKLDCVVWFDINRKIT